MAARRLSTASPATRRIVQTAVSVLLVGVIFFLLFRRVDLAGVWAQAKAMTWIEVATIGAIVGWNILTYSALWMAATPGLGLAQATVLTQSGTAVTNTVPGGSAIGVGMAYSMLNSWGFSRTRAMIAVLMTGAWNTLFKFGLPVLALAIVALQGDATGKRVAAGAAGIVLLVVAVVLFGLVLHSDRVALRAGEVAARVASWGRGLVRRPPVSGWGPATVEFRTRASELLRDRWLAITVTAVVSHLSLYLVLLVSLRHVGVTNPEVSWAAVLAVFALARLLTVVRFTPGGAGAVEAVLIGGLVSAGGPIAKVTAAVLVFRALTWLLPVPLGVMAYLGWRRWATRRGATRPDSKPLEESRSG